MSGESVIRQVTTGYLEAVPDLLWKLALSVHAYQSEGMGITEACATLLDSEHDRVREQTGYEGTEEGVHRLRVRVTRYLQRFKVDRALIDAEFGRWFNYFKWQQRKKLSDQQWYEEVESEFQARICIAQRELRATHWQTGECRLALAGIYHEQAKYSQATECYTKARQELGRASVTKGFRSDLADWIDGQIDNCSEGLPPTPVPTWDPASGKLLPVRQIGQLEAT